MKNYIVYLKKGDLVVKFLTVHHKAIVTKVVNGMDVDKVMTRAEARELAKKLQTDGWRMMYRAEV